MADRKRIESPASRRSRVEAVVWLALAIAAFIVTFEFDGPLPTFEFGAAFWPRVVIAGVIVSAGVLLVSSYFVGARESEAVIDERTTDALSEDAARVTRKTLAIFAIPLVYVYAIHQVGFLLVTPIFLLGYMYLLGVRGWVTLIAVTVGFYGAIVLIFVKLIYTPLPQGAGFFHSLNGQLIGLIQ
ncbi:MAG: tripartite tricarboxylate transporter TctB family protein [Proteobacteria bacterium]|nr:tripartite tricarboxylate transporter TctB family protein [Pseudomonadota bacterium]